MSENGQAREQPVVVPEGETFSRELFLQAAVGVLPAAVAAPDMTLAAPEGEVPTCLVLTVAGGRRRMMAVLSLDEIEALGGRLTEYVAEVREEVARAKLGLDSPSGIILPS